MSRALLLQSMALLRSQERYEELLALRTEIAATLRGSRYLEDLGATLLSHDRTHHASLLEPWLSDGNLVSFADHQHRVELNPIPCGTLEFFDRNQVPLCDAVLFPSSLDDSVHTAPAF